LVTGRLHFGASLVQDTFNTIVLDQPIQLQLHDPSLLSMLHPHVPRYPVAAIRLVLTVCYHILVVVPYKVQTVPLRSVRYPTHSPLQRAVSQKAIGNGQ
jgi:hypothetical protein